MAKWTAGDFCQAIYPRFGEWPAMFIQTYSEGISKLIYIDDEVNDVANVMAQVMAHIEKNIAITEIVVSEVDPCKLKSLMSKLPKKASAELKRAYKKCWEYQADQLGPTDMAGPSEQPVRQPKCKLFTTEQSVLRPKRRELLVADRPALQPAGPSDKETSPRTERSVFRSNLSSEEISPPPQVGSGPSYINEASTSNSRGAACPVPGPSTKAVISMEPALKTVHYFKRNFVSRLRKGNCTRAESQPNEGGIFGYKTVHGFSWRRMLEQLYRDVLPRPRFRCPRCNIENGSDKAMIKHIERFHIRKLRDGTKELTSDCDVQVICDGLINLSSDHFAM